MRITKRRLGRIIKEELQRIISEHPDPWREFDDLPPEEDEEYEEYSDSGEEIARQQYLDDLQMTQPGGWYGDKWDDDIEVSTCCGAQRYDDHDLCIDCGEHADFESEGVWKRGENESI